LAIRGVLAAKSAASFDRSIIGSSYARPNLGIYGDILSENKAKPALFVIDAIWQWWWRVVDVVVNFTNINWWSSWPVCQAA